MKKLLIAIVLIVSVSCVSKEEYNLERQRSYDKGYLDGFKAGQEKAYNDVHEIINSNKK